MGDMIGLRRSRRGTSLVPNYVLLTLLLIFAIGPILVLGFNSLKSNAEIGRNPLGPPTAFHIENFARAWQIGGFSLTMRNSAILVVGTVAGVLTLGGLAAYSLARLDVPGGNILM